MNPRDVYYGRSLLIEPDKDVNGEIVMRDGEPFYRISNFDQMPPFFLSLVSNSDHWMYISSRGGITCGRRNPESALFPYYTDDKIHDASSTTGSKSLVLIERKEKCYLWEPFSMDFPCVYQVTRNLYKNRTGNKLIFEEINHSLRLHFHYTWTNSDKYGFIKHSGISNLDPESGTDVRLIDGILNILPYGVNPVLQCNMSTLVDGYKKCELLAETGLGIYTLGSIPTDRAEPSEALKATTVWSAGLEKPKYLLSGDQLESFRQGRVPETETALEGRRGAYFVYADFYLETGENRNWLIVADVGQGPSDVPATLGLLKKNPDISQRILEDVEFGTEQLNELVARADGNQFSADSLTTARHFSNTLYNIMRGGIFHNDYLVDKNDLKAFARQWNIPVYEKHKNFLEDMQEPVRYHDLIKGSETLKDNDLIRLIYEYLPLTFSRRHGDPSRPWNRFSIDVKKEDGDIQLFYQGNWRDIFQNWEALSISYPGFIESFIAKFVNASTPDGYNPYRITRNGIEWETPDPGDLWSHIGYWGDHQIIYLSRLLECSLRYHPGALHELMTRDLFVYANVPYRIRAYNDLVADAGNSITYSIETEKLIGERVARIGSDGKLLFDSRGEVHQVNLAEKLLVTLLSKLSNFVPGGGIWMNTQRPEWNDANNALAGNGLSMVTLCYLRRYTGNLMLLFGAMTETPGIALEVEELLQAVMQIFSDREELLSGTFSNRERRNMVDQLGMAGENYRNCIYQGGFSGRKAEINRDDLNRFFAMVLAFIDHTIESNRRSDHLFHSYNLIEFGENSCIVSHLDMMLEGQVAVLSSGYLGAGDCLRLLDALRTSRLYRPDQDSFMLYPHKLLPGFLEKNIISRRDLSRSAFFMNEVSRGSREIVEEDNNGNYHFNGSICNAAELRMKLNGMDDLQEEEKDTICNIYTECFDHKHFTGRSGTFYKYEGIGCIYWHMVSKLLVAVQEVYMNTFANEPDSEFLSGLELHYNQIKDGIGLKKPPDKYGAFPTDPYSHSPGFGGVQQPGMTGQVKEDIIARFGELGLVIEDGCIHFTPRLLLKSEFLESENEWKVNREVITLGEGELGFTFCGTPVIYRLGNSATISIELKSGEKIRLGNTHTMERKYSKLVLERTGSVRCIRLELQGFP